MKTVDTSRTAGGVSVSGGFTFIADHCYGLQIINVEPIGSAGIVKSVDTPGRARRVFLSDSYFFI